MTAGYATYRLKFFRKRRKGDDDDLEDGSPEGVSEEEEEDTAAMNIKRRGSLHTASVGKRPSLEQWFEARKARCVFVFVNS